MNHTTIIRLGITLGLLGAAGLAVAGPEGHAHAEDHHAAADRTALSELVPFEQPEVWIGSEAPELEIARFFKGESVRTFEAGHVYVVELWATWCGPCIRMFPHLSELQAKHAGEVTFIGLNVRDTRRNEAQAARLERVAEFVEKQGERMGYTVAIEQGENFGEQLMERAAMIGLPSAYIVDGRGNVAWMGYPEEIDEPLARIVRGEHDYGADAAARNEQAYIAQVYNVVRAGIRSPDAAEAARAYRIGDAFVSELIGDDPTLLNALAWGVVDSDKVTHRDFEFAYRTAVRGCEATDWSSPSILDTAAVAAFKAGKVERAIELEEKAIALTDNDRLRAQLKEQLEEFKAGG